ncbi:myb-like HTH transcriptional regulator family protein [Raphanus sativus]|uniref:Myb family transcription factor PHL6 n=1 Tax=Raphanus sativus TaxID=3726 RepID=A0A6J0NKK9_RAPSA|nr:myb family transcription factor PHL6 [Raphanus sativus]KAJ4918020.1 myb-like HTH transcriptional regulator family protein [Raphanus sativus]
MNSHSLFLSINDGGNTTCCSSSSLASLHSETTRSFPFRPSHFSNGSSFSRSSAFCNLSSSSSSDTKKHLGSTLPFLPNPSPAAASFTFTEEDLLSFSFEEVVDTSFLALSGDGGFQDVVDNFSLSEEQMELQFLSDELQLAITDRGETPRLDEIYQVTGLSPGQNGLPTAMPVLSQQPSPGESAAVNQKPRMRWSPELHDCFLEAVKKLDGPEKATPKAVMKMMNVEGLTIYQVKSHLQKYRLAKNMPERKEEKKSSGSSEDKKPASDTSEANGKKKGAIQLTEALRMQMEVQKQLHQQLEVQRSLQLRIEEHARYLQKILDEQSKAAATSKQDSHLSSSAEVDECETSLKRPRLENSTSH